MFFNRKVLNTMMLAALMVLPTHSETVRASDDQTRVARDIIRTLEAYAVYKMGQYDLAFERYLALAKDGNHQGMLNAAKMYAEGKGVAQSDSESFRWYRTAAEAGVQTGMEETANAYRKGIGVQKDPERARYWETRAEEAGR
ncbi:hypothetical protein SAMN05216203_2328 [Marinobacter daqiaonensis]|uniref:Sel1 repeat-containing protein n=1 Tax=Marinobacter daqiaonensis TaxID=650891 RepID=A0A1I6IHM1_9GAMM|nr:tetratricopeptide repeat protein [Marinobacter daqiaonensis]SFR66206.1 hypothetical protein SAMN05216203_2328 [Marinobacter daqiaonensis]